MQTTARTLLLTLAGAAAGEATHRVLQRRATAEAGSAVLLVTAALAYPMADIGGEHGSERTRELASVGIALAVGLGAACASPRGRRRMLAAAWLSHAAFDVTHRRNTSSRLPRWYPAFCAGFDTVVAAELLRATRT